MRHVETLSPDEDLDLADMIMRLEAPPLVVAEGRVVGVLSERFSSRSGDSLKLCRERSSAQRTFGSGSRSDDEEHSDDRSGSTALEAAGSCERRFGCLPVVDENVVSITGPTYSSTSSRLVGPIDENGEDGSIEFFSGIDRSEDVGATRSRADKPRASSIDDSVSTIDAPSTHRHKGAFAVHIGSRPGKTIVSHADPDRGGGSRDGVAASFERQSA